jgi:nitrate/nitrite-specific signal transduction histidine kinase
MGLRIMKYRADVIGAALKVDKAPGGGTLVSCTFAAGL